VTYSSSLSVSRQAYIRRNQYLNVNTERVRRLGPISSTIAIIALSCVLFLLYLTQVTKTSTYSYQVSELSGQQTQLQEEHAQLEVESARLQALERVKTSQVAQSLPPTSPAGFVAN
jgi:hypothetical protein